MPRRRASVSRSASAFKDQRGDRRRRGGGQGLSDILFGASVSLDPRWSVDSTVQYNPTPAGRSAHDRRALFSRATTGSSVRLPPAARARASSSTSAGSGRSTTCGATAGQDLGRAWAGRGRWYSVGRMNFSMRDRRWWMRSSAWNTMGLLAGAHRHRAPADGAPHQFQPTHHVPAGVRGFSRLGVNPCRRCGENIPATSTCANRSPGPAGSANTIDLMMQSI